MFRRVQQPQIVAGKRSTESRGYVAGTLVAVVGLLLLGSGLRNDTRIQTTVGQPAKELELVRAFAYGGLKHLDDAPPAPPIPTGNPAIDDAALQRWERQVATPMSPASRIRVDIGAQAACPT